jgi:ComF family protein
VVPVPLHRAKSSDRGFNQAEEIARAAVKQLGAFELATRVLVRNRPTTSQTGLTRHQRRANIRGAFEVRDTLKIADRNVIVVDDVMTTGTTAEECARVLRKAGAAKVWIATVARVSKLEAASLGLHPNTNAVVAAAAEA